MEHRRVAALLEEKEAVMHTLRTLLAVRLQACARGRSVRIKRVEYLTAIVKLQV